MNQRHSIIFRLARIAAKAVKYTVFTGVFLLAIVGAWGIYSEMPVHQFQVHCHSFDVYFEGPKSKKFIEVVTLFLSQEEEEYVVENERVYTTMDGANYEQASKMVRYLVHPEWFRKSPVFENEEQERIVNMFKASTESTNVSDEWCHFIEAAISKDGIDAEARRKNPRIWPPDKWHVPSE